MSAWGRFLPVAAAAITGVQVGAAIVATRFVVDQTGPAALGMLRYSIGFFCLLPVILMMPRVRFERADMAPIALLGIVQFGVLIGLLNFGLQYIPAGRAALLFASFPFLTLLFGAALGREALTPMKVTAVLLTMLGVAVALGATALRHGSGPDEWIGALAVLASAASGALCSVLYRPYLQKYPALPISALAMLASVFFLGFLALGEGFFNAVPAITAGGWLAIVFIGVSSGAGYFLWLWALARTTPTRVTVFLALSPLTAALLGAWLLGEPLTPGLLTGLACVAGGLWLLHRQSEPAARLE